MKAFFQTSNTNIGLLLLRALPAAMMLTHGWPKFQKLLAGNMEFADPLGIGSATSLVLTVLAEFFCSILLILGLWTRLAAIPLIITMLVAAFMVHGADPWGKKEFALLYGVCFLVVFITGPGRYSLDQKIYR